MTAKIPTPTKKTSTQLKELKVQLADTTHNWHRAIADYQNLVKRTSQEKQNYGRSANQLLLAKLLPIYDHLLLASTTLKDEGLSLVVTDFQSALESEGVTQIMAEPGTKFDPLVHECVELDKKGKTGLIVSQLKPGYQLNNLLLYPAKVTVGK